MNSNSDREKRFDGNEVAPNNNGASPGHDEPRELREDELLVEFGAEVEHPLDLERLRRVVTRICVDHGISVGHLSFTVLGDERIHALNRETLGHDYPTDVISFDYVEPERRSTRVEGEVVVNADYAAREAPEHGHGPAEELLLYCIHGTLHVLGYDDDEPDAAATMAELQERYLREAYHEEP